MRAGLFLEDGTVFYGESFGAQAEGKGEVVFHTGMTGYQEILTDPSYTGQIVCMTYPLIGNYGINSEDSESDRIHAGGFIVKELSRIYSNWRAEMSLDEFLKDKGVAGIEGIDTRALTRILRDKGSLRGIITTDLSDSESNIHAALSIPDMTGCNLADSVSTEKNYVLNQGGKYRVAVIDCGVKKSILNELISRSVFPSSSSAENILSFKPDGLFLSNGPGDPEPVQNVVSVTKELLGKLPIFGICLGHQILSLALGGKTYKLRFGHHGGNHPVRVMSTGHIQITSQNHNFCSDINSFNRDEIEITHLNLNDNTVEGIRHKTLPAFSVQYHPESAPGPWDAKVIFDDFISLIKRA